MRLRAAFLLALAAAVFAGCADFRHRTFRFGEPAPVKPFSITLRDAEYALRDGRLLLRVHVEVANKSGERQSLARDRFTLRVGRDTELRRDLNLIERVGLDTARFEPGEIAILTLPFTLTVDALAMPIRLVVDRQPLKGGGERLTLLDVKHAARPASLPAHGEWDRVSSAHW
ncbi:MAG: hypothetical protein ACOYMV_02940 [Verrucomicrobiia bacterium]|jgi:hypothetical protein